MALVDAARAAGLDALREASGAGEDPVAIAEAAWWVLFDCRPKLSVRRAEQLRRAVACLDRYANFGAGGPGVGVGLLLDLLQAYADDVAAGQRPPIHSLAFVVCELRRISRQWRRNAKGLPPVPDTGQAEHAAAADRALEAWHEARRRAHVARQRDGSRRERDRRQRWR